MSAPGGTTRFLYDGNDVIAEYNPSGTLLRRYVHGPSLDEPLVWYEGSTTGDRRYLLADERGSVIGVTNAAGQVTTVNKYDAYGVPNANNQGRFQYTGQMWLPELGLYHYKARVYHPQLGRFLQTDPIGTAGGMNLYAYTGGDPVNKHDPSGHDGEETLKQQLGCSVNQTHCQAMPFICYASRINTAPGSGCGGSLFDPTYYNSFADYYAAISERSYRHNRENGPGGISPLTDDEYAQTNEWKQLANEDIHQIWKDKKAPIPANGRFEIRSTTVVREPSVDGSWGKNIGYFVPQRYGADMWVGDIRIYPAGARTYQDVFETLAHEYGHAAASWSEAQVEWYARELWKVRNGATYGVMPSRK